MKKRRFWFKKIKLKSPFLSHSRHPCIYIIFYTANFFCFILKVSCSHSFLNAAFYWSACLEVIPFILLPIFCAHLSNLCYCLLDFCQSTLCWFVILLLNNNFSCIFAPTYCFCLCFFSFWHPQKHLGAIPQSSIII